MNHPNHTTNQCKQKHLNFEERMTIQLRLKENNTDHYGICADAGEANYNKHRKNCCPQFKRLKCDDFIQYVYKYMKEHNWSVDTCVGNALQTGKFQRHEMVCTKTLYNYIDLGLLKVKNIDLPMKLKRNTKSKRVRANKRKLGTSIEDRPEHILTREEFGHWEIDTVIGTKDKADRVLLSITCDNGLEFAELHKIKEQSDVKVYFTHPYASSERGTNERHNGLLRRFIPKGMNINHYSVDEIALVEDWCNTLPRKILGYRTPEELFEEQMDILYAL